MRKITAQKKGKKRKAYVPPSPVQPEVFVQVVQQLGPEEAAIDGEDIHLNQGFFTLSSFFYFFPYFWTKISPNNAFGCI